MRTKRKGRDRPITIKGRAKNMIVLEEWKAAKAAIKLVRFFFNFGLRGFC